MEAVKPPKVLTASTLKGNKVTNVKGEDLGKVEEIMIDLERGQVAYVVLSFGRANWMPNNKLFAVPWEVLSISYHDKKFILNVSEETLKSAPGFDRDKWPDVADFGWLAKEIPIPVNVTGIGNDKPK
jgi:sporulation protein YlmC with PRC-barrel domain